MSIDIRAHGLRPATFELVAVEEAELLTNVVERFARESGREITAIAIEDEENDLDLTVEARVVLSPRTHVHFHRRHLVHVTVSYAGQPIERDFRPNQRLKRVFDWAVGKHGFDLDPLDAGELVLAMGDPPQRVDVDLHVGDLADTHDRLSLLLVPKTFFQG